MCERRSLFKIPNSAVFWSDVQAQNFSLYKTPLDALRKVSGRLKRLLRDAGKAAPAKAPVPHLLIVDDEEAICLAMSEYFLRRGFRVDTAKEIDEAESLIEENVYEVIIQDLRLGITPHYRGLDIIKLARRRSPETRIVVLTSYGADEIETEARRVGAHAFLRKPKPLSQVAQVIQGLIESPRRGSGH
jgi:DNA-binding NtrC family response regulator